MKRYKRVCLSLAIAAAVLVSGCSHEAKAPTGGAPAAQAPSSPDQAYSAIYANCAKYSDASYYLGLTQAKLDEFSGDLAKTTSAGEILVSALPAIGELKDAVDAFKGIGATITVAKLGGINADLTTAGTSCGIAQGNPVMSEAFKALSSGDSSKLRTAKAVAECYATKLGDSPIGKLAQACAKTVAADLSTPREVRAVKPQVPLAGGPAKSPEAAPAGKEPIVSDVKVLRGHDRPIVSVSWSPDGSKVVSASHDGKIYIWDVSAGVIIRTIEHGRFPSQVLYSASLSPDGKKLASTIGGEIRIWDADTGSLLKVFNVDDFGSHLLAWSPDEAKVATFAKNRAINIWDVTTGTLLKTLPHHKTTLGKVADSGRFIAWSPDGTKLATVTSADPYSPDLILIRDVSSGTELQAFNALAPLVNPVLWSPDGTKLAAVFHDAGDYKSPSTAGILDVSSGSILRVFKGSSLGFATDASWSPDGTKIAVGYDDRAIRVWDAASGNLVKILEGHTDDVQSVSWSPKGGLLASGSEDNTIRIWNVRGL